MLGYLIRRSSLSKPWNGSTSIPFRRAKCQRSPWEVCAPVASAAYSTEAPPPNLAKVLVANRGEIACRVIRTCRRLGIPTVALYSNADGPHALHAQMADEAYLIGTGPTPAESYLRQDEIVHLAKQVGVEAIHPGYGFLSENASFADAIQREGLKFVGPPTKAIQAMGSKSESKAIMDKAGVPTTPGYYEAEVEGSDSLDSPQDPHLLLSKAVEIGFPVLIKAVMGGGGKGMRLVWNESEFLEGLASCQREAKSAFGNEKVLLEKYLVRPRHIEVQVLADEHENVVSLYERDCSLQRRHQKIIEEAPASDLAPELRQEFGRMARLAAKAVGYRNAGTVEFLLDTQNTTGPNLQSFYFCEMNTRLQVEHPVTEAITGQDLVEWQLRIAAGEVLPITDSADIPCHGHAFEARIYAEQPTRNFLPATGHVFHHAPPVAKLNTEFDADSTNRVRVDTCIQTGQDVSVYYDPMISKLIVHGADRANALKTLVKALKNYQIAGVPTNIDFLIQCAEHETFRKAGAINTGFLDDYTNDLNLDDEVLKARMSPPVARAVGAYAALLFLEKRKGSNRETTKVSSPWSSEQGSWRIGGQEGRAKRRLVMKGSDEEKRVDCVSNLDGSFDILVPGKERSVHLSGGFLEDDGSLMEVQINGDSTVRLSCILREKKGVLTVKMWPQNLPSEYAWEVDFEHPLAPESLARSKGGSHGGSGEVKAPMPGKISRVNFQVGDKISEGDVVLVMEAMKMEHSIKASVAGVLGAVHHKVGDIVSDDDSLFEIAA